MYKKSEGLKFKSPEEIAEQEQNSLKIITITGPMGAGKSNEILNIIRRLEEANRKYICFRPENSKRENDDTARITSRNQEFSVEAKFLEEKFDANKMAETIDNYDVFIFDEIHFLDLDSIKSFVQKCIETHKKKELIFAGLDRDFHNNKFEQTAFVRGISNATIILTAQCSVQGCEKRAPFTAKIGGNLNQQIETGKEDKYAACCPEHHAEINKSMESCNNSLDKTFEKSNKTNKSVTK